MGGGKERGRGEGEKRYMNKLNKYQPEITLVIKEIQISSIENLF